MTGRERATVLSRLTREELIDLQGIDAVLADRIIEQIKDTDLKGLADPDFITGLMGIGLKRTDILESYIQGSAGDCTA